MAADLGDRIALLRVGLAAAAVVAWLLRRPGPTGRPRSAARAALGLIAATAFAANYDFFPPTGFHRHELYHYYLGSKYFPELGYFRLYECSVEALRERGLAAVPVEITDLRSKRRLPAAEVLATARACRPDFAPERWRAFQDDVASFERQMGPARWVGVLRDHGYNPSPVWTLVGRPIASLVPSTPAGLRALARLDVAVLLAGFAAVGWAFGFEAACLAVIAWGACGLTRYEWTGDAFLRQMWFASVLASLSLLRRGRHAASGALLAFAAGLRVFPGALFVGYALWEARRFARTRAPSRGFVRFAAAAAATGVLLAGAATGVAGRGADAWREFALNTEAMTSFTPRNALGLSYLLGFDPAPPPPEVVASTRSVPEAIEEHKRRTLARRRGLQAAALAGFAWLFWRAVRPVPAGGARPPAAGAERIADWEALAAGAFLIPVLALPASYYVGFVAVGAPLATRRPRIGLALLLAALGFAIAVAVHGDGRLAYLWSSVVLIAYCAWALLELGRPPALPGTEPPPALSAAEVPAMLSRPGPH